MTTRQVLFALGFASLSACGSSASEGAPDARSDDGAPSTQGMEGGEGSGGAAEGGEGAEAPTVVTSLAPAATCTPSGDACAAPTLATTTFASYRKDAYFEDSVYDEYTDAPLDGGRIHVIATATGSGRVTGMSIAGQDPADIYAPTEGEQPAFEWAHIWPEQLVEGEPVWVSFHSRDAAWDATEQAELVVETDSGEALRTMFPVSTSSVRLTYVTFADDLGTALVHLANRDELDAVPVGVEHLVQPTG